MTSSPPPPPPIHDSLTLPLLPSPLYPLSVAALVAIVGDENVSESEERWHKLCAWQSVAKSPRLAASVGRHHDCCRLDRVYTFILATLETPQTPSEVRTTEPIYPFCLYISFMCSSVNLPFLAFNLSSFFHPSLFLTHERLWTQGSLSSFRALSCLLLPLNSWKKRENKEIIYSVKKRIKRKDRGK